MTRLATRVITMPPADVPPMASPSARPRRAPNQLATTRETGSSVAAPRPTPIRAGAMGGTRTRLTWGGQGGGKFMPLGSACRYSPLPGRYAPADAGSAAPHAAEPAPNGAGTVRLKAAGNPADREDGDQVGLRADKCRSSAMKLRSRSGTARRWR